MCAVDRAGRGWMSGNTASDLTVSRLLKQVGMWRRTRTRVSAHHLPGEQIPSLISYFNCGCKSWHPPEPLYTLSLSTNQTHISQKTLKIQTLAVKRVDISNYIFHMSVLVALENDGAPCPSAAAVAFFNPE